VKVLHYVIYFAAVLLAVCAFVYFAGRALPEAHEASVAADYSVPPEEIWPIISEPARFTEWRSGLTKVEVQGERVTEHSSFGVMAYRFAERRQPSRLTTEMLNGREMGFEGNWTFDLAPVAGGTRLIITERGRVFHPVFRWMARYVFGHEKTMRAYHADLARRLAAR